MKNDAISSVLIIFLIGISILFLILFFVLIILLVKNKVKNIDKIENKRANNSKYNKKSRIDNEVNNNKSTIFDFMDFDTVEDSMIIQKNGKRFVMVVECQGVNYDLMSEIEKVSVEEGFQQFLNTLRYPIQIYIQTRTINLESSINIYKDKVRKIEDNFNRMNFKYNQMIQNNNYPQEELDKMYYEIIKEKNLLEYAEDIVRNTERMSLNKNVLNRKYYVIISYYFDENDGNHYDKEEAKNQAFSELYIKAQSIIRTLSSCSVLGKVLDSTELVELLYMSYNRDDAEVLGIDKAIMAQYDNLYSTSIDVYEKKKKVLDDEIERRAFELANKTVKKVKLKKQEEIEEQQKSMDRLVKNLAKIIIAENEKNIGIEDSKSAIKEIEKEKGVKGKNDKK